MTSEPIPRKRLGKEHIETLWLASHGFTIDESAELSDVPRRTLCSRRLNLCHRVGALNIAHAVRVGFEEEYLEVEEEAVVPPFELSSLEENELRLISLGHTVLMSVDDLSISVNAVQHIRHRLTEGFHAYNMPHLVRRGFEAHILTSDLPSA
jgi:hypothetical protein